MAFGIFSQCFAQRLSFFFVVVFPCKFSKLICYFLFNFDESFWKTCGFKLIRVPRGLFKPSAGGFPHFKWGCRVDFFGGHCFSYLFGELVLFVFLISFMFFLDFCPFLLEVISASTLGPFLFQVHLKSMWKLFPLGVVACVPFFE